jgi:hypothetical protein
MAEITIGGTSNLKVPQPYEKGHPCLEHEAGALNQLVTENVRNNLRVKIQDAMEKGATKEEIQNLVTDYCKSYDFGQRGGGGFRATDPIQAEMMDLARKKIKRAYVKKGGKLKDLAPAVITQKAKTLIDHEVHGPKLRKEAEANIKRRDADMDEIIATL